MSFSLVQDIEILVEKKQDFERKAGLLKAAGILVGESRKQAEVYTERARFVGLMIQAQREGTPVMVLLEKQENPKSFLIKEKEGKTQQEETLAANQIITEQYDSTELNTGVTQTRLESASAFGD